MIPSFEVSKEDAALIRDIVDRWYRMGKGALKSSDKLAMSMDITACHANGNPLRLADLLRADNFNFTHDVCGIARHIDRNTSKLADGFTPRYSRRER